MALMGSLVSGVSAMQSFVKGMEVIGDNIANSKTVGFKRQRVNYSDNFSDTLRDATPGGVNSSNQPPVQVGAGVNVAAAQKVMEQGAVELTGVASDLAISGSGFFRVLNASSEEQFLTRDGSFRLDESGFLTDKNGNYLLGLTGGSPTESPSVIGRLQVDLDSSIKVDSVGRPLDGSGRIVLEDGTRALENADSRTGYYRVDSTGRLLDSQSGNIILSDLDNNSTTTEFAKFDDVLGKYILVNDAGNRIDSFGAELEAFNPRGQAPIGAAEPAANTLFDAFNAAAGRAYEVNAAGNYVDASGDDLGVTFDPEVAPDPVSPTTGNYVVYNESVSEFYLVNAAGNYVDSTGADLGEAFDPAVTPTVTPSSPTAGTIFNAYNAADGQFYQVNDAGNYVDANGVDLGEAFDPATIPTVPAVGPAPGETFAAWNEAAGTFYNVNAAGDYVDSRGLSLRVGFDPSTAFSFGGVASNLSAGESINVYNRADGQFYQINESGNYVDASGNDTGIVFDATVPASGTSAHYRYNTADSAFYLVNAAGNYVDANGVDLGEAFAVGASPTAAAVEPAAGSTFFALNDDTNYYRVNTDGNYVDENGVELDGDAGTPGTQSVAFDPANPPSDADGTGTLDDLTALVNSPVGGSIGTGGLTPTAGTIFNAYNPADGSFYQLNANGNYVDASGNLLQAVEWDPGAQALANPGSVAALFAEYNPDSPAAGSPRVALPDINDVNQFKLAIQSWTINKDGELALALNDGTTYVRGQVLLQQISDEDALVEEGAGLYSGFGNAGAIGMNEWNIGGSMTAEQRALHDPNQGGIGFIQSRALEGSNTDLTQEFADMITTQRAFQAGSRVITVSDEMLQDIINLKR